MADIVEFTNEQLDICRDINAEKTSFSFEKEEWKIKIEVTRK